MLRLRLRPFPAKRILRQLWLRLSSHKPKNARINEDPVWDEVLWISQVLIRKPLTKYKRDAITQVKGARFSLVIGDFVLCVNGFGLEYYETSVLRLRLRLRLRFSSHNVNLC